MNTFLLKTIKLTLTTHILQFGTDIANWKPRVVDKAKLFKKERNQSSNYEKIAILITFSFKLKD